MSDANVLFERVRERLRDPVRRIGEPFLTKGRLPAPASPQSFADVEANLGFPLPPLLRRLYTELANGGFGPSYGFVGIAGGATDDRRHTLEQLYESDQTSSLRKRFPNWPTRIVRVCYWGCAMYSCIDCSTPGFLMYHFEPNPDEADLGYANCLIPHNRSFDQYVEAWLDDVDLLNDVFPGYADP